MIDILKTKWIRSKKGLKQMNIEFQYDDKVFNYAIRKNRDIDNFVSSLDWPKKQKVIIIKLLIKWFEFNKSECKRVQKINLTIENKLDS